MAFSFPVNEKLIICKAWHNIGERKHIQPKSIKTKKSTIWKIHRLEKVHHRRSWRLWQISAMIDIDIVYILCIDDIDIDIDWPLPNYLKKFMGFGAKIPGINYKSTGILSEFHQTIKSERTFINYWAPAPSSRCNENKTMFIRISPPHYVFTFSWPTLLLLPLVSIFWSV